MSLLDVVRYRMRVLLGSERHARELREEIDFHLSLDAVHETDGAPRRRFGNVTHYKEEARLMSGLGFFDTARQDIRFALRTFRHSPAFTAVAVLTIALGIGATAAIFSVVDAVILRPLPYPDAERIVMVWMDNRRQSNAEDYHSVPNLADLKAQNQVLSHLAPYAEGGYNLTGSGEPQRVIAGILPTEALAAIGVQPLAGRMYDAENEVAGNDAVVVLGHGLWQNAFGGDQSVIGREIELNGRKRMVVGIMPERFAFPSERTQLWIPLVIPERLKTARFAYAFPAIGRLKPGVSIERARSEMSAIAKRLEEEYPQNRDYGVTVVPLPEHVVGPTLRTALWIMLGAVAAVLLIACANVANLLLSRAAVRTREVTVRLALGASSRRLVRQLLTESLVLSLIGGVAGVLLALGGLRILKAAAPADLPRIADVALNPTVLLVTGALTIVTGLLFGLVPAMQSSRASLSGTLREGGRGGTAGHGGQRLRRLIVAAQLALVVVVLTGAGLLVRTFITLQQTDLGFAPERILTATIQLPGARYPQPPLSIGFYESLLERVRALPGVQAAGTVTTMLLSKTPNSGNITAEGREPTQQDAEVTFDAASPGFFEAVGAKIVAGRSFDRRDTPDAPRVAVVNEHMAKYYWPNIDPVGRRFRFGGPSADTTARTWVTVVGVVANMRRTGVDMPVRDELFVAYAQQASLGNMLVVKTAGDPLALAPLVRQAVTAIDRDQPVSSIRTMEDMLSGVIAQRRFNTILIGAFAVLALVLAIVGAYGVTSYLVAQRTKEIGVRIALGAEPARVARMVVADGMRVAAAGVAVGIVGAVLASRLVASLLYGVSPGDPITIGAVSAILLLVAAAANYLPARRAARVDPLMALRDQ